MGPSFPELQKNEEKIKDIITEEEISFGRTLLKVIYMFVIAIYIALVIPLNLIQNYYISPGYRQVQKGYCRHCRWKIKWAGMSIYISKILTENVQGSGLGIIIPFMIL